MLTFIWEIANAAIKIKPPNAAIFFGRITTAFALNFLLMPSSPLGFVYLLLAKEICPTALQSGTDSVPELSPASCRPAVLSTPNGILVNGRYDLLYWKGGWDMTLLFLCGR